MLRLAGGPPGDLFRQAGRLACVMESFFFLSFLNEFCIQRGKGKKCILLDRAIGEYFYANAATEDTRRMMMVKASFSASSYFLVGFMENKPEGLDLLYF